MLRRAFVASLTLAALASLPARAHFIWVDVKPEAKGAEAQLYFGEAAEPSEPHLITKVGHAKAWIRSAAGATEVKLTPQTTEETAALVGPASVAGEASLEAFCDYGVYPRGPGLLLQYYAKRLTGDWAKQPSLARAEKLKLDVVPTFEGDKLAVQVLFDGQPSVKSEVVFVDPAGEHLDVKTNAEGRAHIQAGGGRWAVRAAHIQQDKAGERDGKKYTQTWHYATLVVDVPGTEKVATKQTNTAAVAGEIPALDALTRARAGRAMWENFPGFTSDLVVRSAGQEYTGKVEINADGVVTLDMPKTPVTDWVEEQLNSLVQHRMPDGEVTQGDVTYADEDVNNPLGRKIDLGDPSLQSAYRLKDDVIMEVNRNMGPVRFTISVLEIVRNAEQKYLPRSFTMNFFDIKSGDLRTSLAYWNDWQRVGKFDLPKTIVEVDARKGGATTKAIEFANAKLLN